MVIFGGDFRQTLPVVLKGNRPQILNASLKRSRFWPHIRQFSLKTNMRLIGENAEQLRLQAQFLLQVGEGRNGFDKTVVIPESMVAENLDSLISQIYPENAGNIYVYIVSYNSYRIASR